MQQLNELHKSKPSEKNDEGMIQALARLEAELTTAMDDKVGFVLWHKLIAVCNSPSS